jgi:hypothetical protein
MTKVAGLDVFWTTLFLDHARMTVVEMLKTSSQELLQWGESEVPKLKA